jgi:hypothetical protein
LRIFLVVVEGRISGRFLRKRRVAVVFCGVDVVGCVVIVDSGMSDFES